VPVDFNLTEIRPNTQVGVLLKALSEFGSVSDLKFTNEDKSKAFAKILFEPTRLQELQPLSVTLQ